MQVGDTLVYPNGDKDRIVGETELAGVPIILLEPVNLRNQCESFKSKKFVTERLQDGTWRLVKHRFRLKGRNNGSLKQTYSFRDGERIHCN